MKTVPLLANLDCEARWGNAPLKRAVLRRISAAGALLAALAPEGVEAEVWTPAEVAAERVRFATPRMRVGEPARWELAWADPAARAANDRRVAAELEARLGEAPPGARIVTSLDELDAHLAGGGAAPGLDRRWVCKTPWTAAGRDRAHGQGDGATGEVRTYLGRLLARTGALLFEPWLDRTLDVGVCARLEAGGRVVAEAPHTLRSDPRGGFVGIDLAPPPLLPEERARLDAAVAAAGDTLAAIGYAGPFSVDAFAYRAAGDAAGPRRFRPLCEVNARHTFGHVARALAARSGLQVLGFGPPPAGARVLVAPAADDPFTAWGA